MNCYFFSLSIETLVHLNRPDITALFDWALNTKLLLLLVRRNGQWKPINHCSCGLVPHYGLTLTSPRDAAVTVASDKSDFDAQADKKVQNDWQAWTMKRRRKGRLGKWNLVLFQQAVTQTELYLASVATKFRSDSAVCCIRKLIQMNLCCWIVMIWTVKL